MKYVAGMFLSLVGIILLMVNYSKISVNELGIICLILGLGLWFDARINSLKYTNNLKEGSEDVDD